MKRIIFTSVCIFLFALMQSYAQSGMFLPELEKKLQPYFADDLIKDLKEQLPTSRFTIWGWDVGDFSGDGYFDVAFTVNILAEKRRVVYVYFFVDIDGFLTKVGAFEYEYIDLPLEIGVVIKDNTCFITKKRDQYNWLIEGFKFENGCFVKLDEFTTERLGSLTKETYRNYQTMINTYKFLKTTGGEEVFSAKFLTIPCYPREKLISFGYQPDVFSNYIDFVPAGAYHWKGDKDASFRVRSAYDNEYLYMSVYVRDDNVITSNCEACVSDFIELWFDARPVPKNESRFVSIKGRELNIRNTIDSGVYRFAFYPGDFYEEKPFSDASQKVASSDNLLSFQRLAIGRIKSVSAPLDSGYVIKFKIPFMVFGFDSAPIFKDDITEFGCSIVVHDADNQYRMNEVTQIATSAIDTANPSTYGSIIFIPHNKWYGESTNIYIEDIVKFLQENGF